MSGIVRSVMTKIVVHGSLGISALVLQRRGQLCTGPALRALTGNPDSCDFVITDRTMPDMTGVALAKEIVTIGRNMPVVLCTGYGEAVPRELTAKVGIRGLVRKPVSKREMARAIRRAVTSESDVNGGREGMPPLLFRSYYFLG